MQLYLARHGEALTAEEDPSRPLNNQGKDNVSRLGSFLHKANVSFSCIYHSAKLRSKETAEILHRTLSSTFPLKYLPALDPEENLYHLYSAFKEFPDQALLVGHLPNLELLANYLLAGSYDRPTIQFSPGAMACFVQAGNGWLLKWLVEPKLLTP